MRLTHILAAGFFAVAMAAASLANAATTAVYTEQAFAASQQQGKPILVHVTAPWCPTCKQQHPILSKLEEAPEYKDMVVYNVDFDSQKDVLRKMNVTTQSTLIVFHGGVEKTRSTGETNPAKIAAILAQVNQ